MSDQTPNILLITTDQQHFGVMGCAGDPHVRTPSLDSLAASGTRFERAYSPNPVCVPCRYSWMTGRMPHVFDGIETNCKTDRSSRPVIRNCIDTPCMGHALRQAGYGSWCGGKMHVEGPYVFTPEEEETYGFSCLTSDCGDGLARACEDFLFSPPCERFFLWASFDQPHDICKYADWEEALEWAADLSPTPLPANFEPTRNEVDWVRGFRDGTLGEEESFELGLNRMYGRLAHDWPEETWRHYRSVYRRCVEEADRRIGRVLNALRESGLENNTVVIFASDHGEHDGAHRLAMKRSFYEESVHVPMMIRTPDQRMGETLDESHLINTGTDLLPTLLDFAGSDPHPALPGRSLRPLVEGPGPTKWRASIVSETVGGRMVRTPRYKYTLLHERRSEEQLFDMREDPGEMHDLAAEPGMESVLREHRQLLRRRVEEREDTRGRRYLDALT